MSRSEINSVQVGAREQPKQKRYPMTKARNVMIMSTLTVVQVSWSIIPLMRRRAQEAV